MTGTVTDHARAACNHPHAVCSPASESGGVTSLAPYLYPPHDPMGLLIPRLGRRGCHRYADVEKILAGERHGPVVYFVRIGRDVKIGTTGDLRARMRRLYLDLDDVLAVVPGDKHIEALYHQRFSRARFETRSELFRLDLWLRLYLARLRCSWAEAVAAFAVSFAPALAIEPYELGLTLGVLSYAAIMATLLMRPGWRWR